MKCPHVVTIELHIEEGSWSLLLDAHLPHNTPTSPQQTILILRLRPACDKICVSTGVLPTTVNEHLLPIFRSTIEGKNGLKCGMKKQTKKNARMCGSTINPQNQKCLRKIEMPPTHWNVSTARGISWTVPIVLLLASCLLASYFFTATFSEVLANSTA